MNMLDVCDSHNGAEDDTDNLDEIVVKTILMTRINY